MPRNCSTSKKTDITTSNCKPTTLYTAVSAPSSLGLRSWRRAASSSTNARQCVPRLSFLPLISRQTRGSNWIVGHSEVIQKWRYGKLILSTLPIFFTKFWSSDAVGTIIDVCPPHRTLRALLRIRLPPWVSSVEAHNRIGMQDELALVVHCVGKCGSVADH